VRTLTEPSVAQARLHSLLLLGEGPTSCAEVAAWFGAMQAQDVASGKWSLGVRLDGAREADVDAAFERAEVVRTWPMRGTIHIVPATDIRWMVALTGGRALDASQPRRRQLGLEADDTEQAVRILETALRANGRLTRARCLEVLAQSGIATDGQRGYHLLGYAAQTGVICIGPNDGKEQTFALIDGWAPTQRTLVGKDALTELAYRFFRSHGPATVRDFSGWSGLTLTDGRKGVSANHGRLVARDFRGEQVWLTGDLAELIDAGAARSWRAAVALPGFDEFVLGYKDRSVQIRPDDFDRIVPGGNGVFRATVCMEGRAIGSWTRSLKRSEVVIDFTPFRSIDDRRRHRVDQAFEKYGRYLGLPVRLA
jgi:hypothetical protein